MLIDDERGRTEEAGAGADTAASRDYAIATLLISLIAGLGLSWLAGMIVQSIMFGNHEGLLHPGRYIESSVYSAFCFPIEALVVIVGAIIGGLLGRRAGHPIKGATRGVWVATLLGMVIGVRSAPGFENWT